MPQTLDKSTALEKIPHDYSTYSKLSADLKLDSDVVRITLQKTGTYCIGQIPMVVFENDRSLALLALSAGFTLDKLPSIYKSDKEMVLKDYKKRYCYGPIHANLDLWDDKDFVSQLLDLDPSIEYLPESLKDDREIIMKLISKDGRKIEFASERLKNDDELIILASSNAAIFNCTKPRELSKELCLKIIHRQGKANRDIPSYLKFDRDIVKAHLTYFTNYSYFSNVDRSFTADEEMAALVLSRDIEQWKYIDKSLKDNDSFLSYILTVKPAIFKFFDSDKQYDKEYALKAMKYGKNLELVSTGLKNDKDVVMEAVSNSGQSIRYASKKLRQDKEVIEAALNNDFEGVTYVLSKLSEEEKFIGTWRFQFKVGEHSQYNHDLMIFDLVLNPDNSYLLFNQNISEDYDAGYPRTNDRKTTGKWKIGIYEDIDALYLDELALMSMDMLNECRNCHTSECERFREEADDHKYSNHRMTFSFADGPWSERLYIGCSSCHH